MAAASIPTTTAAAVAEPEPTAGPVRAGVTTGSKPTAAESRTAVAGSDATPPSGRSAGSFVSVVDNEHWASPATVFHGLGAPTVRPSAGVKTDLPVRPSL